MIKKYKIICLSLIIAMSSSLIACDSNKDSQIKNDENNTTKEELNINENKVKEEHNIDIEKIVVKLSSNEIKSRGFKDDGNKLAVDYINNVFSDMNLETVFDSSYLHQFTFENKDATEDGKLINEEIKLNNIVAKVSGKNNKKAIVITAHIDSFGKGVLDNASGVGTALKIADILKNDIPNYDVIFCITNAELQGFIGSKYFINDIKSKYDNLYNVNIDCIGLKTGGPIALKNISKVEESEKLYSSLKNQFTQDGIEFEDIISTDKLKMALENNLGVSDYFSFEEEKIPNIHIAQSGIAPLPEKENDGPETLDYNNLNKISKGIAKWIISADF